MQILKSIRPNKRFVAIFKNGKKVHFGSKGQSYIDHGNKDLRSAYLARHAPRENWNDPYSPGSLSRWLLWGDYDSLDKNHNAFMRKFPNV